MPESSAAAKIEDTVTVTPDGDGEKLEGLTYSEALATCRVNPARSMRRPSWTPGLVMRMATPEEMLKRATQEHHAWLMGNVGGGSLRPANVSAADVVAKDWMINADPGELAAARAIKEAADQKAIDDRKEAEDSPERITTKDGVVTRPRKS